MKVTMIAAVGANGALGKDGKMPWFCREDLLWFREQTMNKPVIMGRKTYESIGKHLDGRRSIVVTRQPVYEVPPEGVTVQSVGKALEAAVMSDGEIMIIGGGQLYEELMPIADRLLITHFEQSFEADTFFPEIDPKHWTGVKIKDGEYCSHELQYSFWEYLRNDQPRT